MCSFLEEAVSVVTVIKSLIEVYPGINCAWYTFNIYVKGSYKNMKYLMVINEITDPQEYYKNKYPPVFLLYTSAAILCGPTS
jgi:hypothetical protein